ncbi:MAG: formylglycine-generating enzyme family protein [Bacteroidota bacterium]
MKHILTIFLLCVAGLLNAGAQTNPDMVKVAGGRFIMGDVKGGGEPDERPLHQVTLDNFSIAKTEVTVAQWRAYCKATNRQMPDPPSWGWKENHPIVNVSWEEAVAYCKWLSESAGKSYRLPTEAEWEYAAKGGAKSKGYLYSGSNRIDDVAWFKDNSHDSTHPVALKLPNELGLYDMSGNAFEWCSDYLEEYNEKPAVNPSGAVKGTFVLRRGGSWNDIAARNRCTYRVGNSFRRSYHSLGFRVASPDK